MAPESSIVIVEGVTLALIDNGGKKVLPEGPLSSDSGYARVDITASGLLLFSQSGRLVRT